MRYPWLLVCCLVVQTATALEIEHIYHEPNYFEPANNEKVDIHFTLNEAAAVSLNIYDGRDLLINRINTRRKKGAQSLSWDGKDMVGNSVPAEAYRYTLVAEAAGKRAEYDASDVTGGDKVVPKNIDWDQTKKVIRYQLSKPSRVIIRLGIQKHGPLMRSMLDWVPREAGFQEESWDGMDASGVINLASHPKLEINVQAFGLSDNSIIVGPHKSAVQLIEDIRWGKERRSVKHKKEKRMFAHSQQPIETRGDLTIKLVLAKDYKTKTDGVPIVSGTVPVRLDVSDKDRARLLERGFEPIFFLDGFFMHENEMGFLPVTWRWDTTGITEGEHFITGNIRSYEGNYGAATLKVFVEQGHE